MGEAQRYDLNIKAYYSLKLLIREVFSKKSQNFYELLMVFNSIKIVLLMKYCCDKKIRRYYIKNKNLLTFVC
jgi:hypothetical protein